MKLYKLFMKYKYCIIGILIIIIIYNSTQPVVEGATDATQAAIERKRKLQEKRTLKYIDQSLAMYESVLKSEEKNQTNSVTINKRQKSAILKALDGMEKMIDKGIVKRIFKSNKKDIQGYWKDVGTLFGKGGAEIERYQKRIKMIRKALKNTKSSSSSSSSSGKKKGKGKGWF